MQLFKQCLAKLSSLTPLPIPMLRQLADIGVEGKGHGMNGADSRNWLIGGGRVEVKAPRPILPSTGNTRKINLHGVVLVPMLME